MKSTSSGAKALLLFLFASTLYICTRSRGLDDWDSVQFAMGVREFNLFKNQPHPPGYPLYIFFGWLVDHLFHGGPGLSLHIVSCLGGGLLIAAWFLIAGLYFSEQFAWLLAVSLTVTPVVWMTSTKVLSDGAAAGLLSLQLFFALSYKHSLRARSLSWAAFLAAIAVGVRPQLFPIALLILLIASTSGSSRLRLSVVTSLCFVAGCFLWLIPTAYTQSHLPGYSSDWLNYPAQIYRQWHWRLDRPDVFIGAAKPTLSYFGLRFTTHILGWFGVGVGLLYNNVALAIGSLLVISGLVAFFVKRQPKDKVFWRDNLLWAIAYVVIIFCCLPADQRYYVVIMPLLLVALLRGLLFLKGPWKLFPLLLPMLLLAISIPCAIANRTEEAPPVKAVRFLQNRYSAQDRGKVLLLLTHIQRHFEWYGPEFDILPVTNETTITPELLESAEAIYIDEPGLKLPSGWQLFPVAEFRRSPVIYRKHDDVKLFQIKRVLQP